MTVTVRKARWIDSSRQAWSTIQRRNAVKTQLEAESAAALSRVAKRRQVHQIAAKALSDVLDASEKDGMLSPYIRVGLTGLSNLHHYIGNPNIQMNQPTATFVLQSLDELIGEIHTLFRLATKAGGQL